MRHRNTTKKLQRTSSQRKALLSGLACSLIDKRRIRTTLAKAKALRPYFDKLVTLGKKANASEDAAVKVHLRRQAIGQLNHRRAPEFVGKLFDTIATASSERSGGYTRIIKLGARQTDSAPMAYIELVDLPVAVGGSDDE